MTLYAFDGTGNAWGGLKSTLVFDVAMSYHYGLGAKSESGDDGPIKRRNVLYLPGVGTTWWIFGALIGGITGAGAKRRARQAYNHLCEVYDDLDADPEDLLIDVVGFSRGGATALHFCNMVRHLGVRRPRPSRPNSWRPYRIGVGWIWFRDWTCFGNPSKRADLLADRLPKSCRAVASGANVIPRIRFVGLWDAVGSFGIPLDTRVFDLQSMEFGFNLALPPNVNRCAHAMALDERRKTFRNLRVTSDLRRQHRSLTQQRRFRHVSLLAITTLAAGLVLWPLGFLDVRGVRLGWLAVVASLWGAGTLLGSYNVPAERRWRGMELGLFATAAVTAFFGLDVLIEGISDRPANAWRLVFVFVASILFSVVQPIAADIANGGTLTSNPVRRAREEARDDPALLRAQGVRQLRFAVNVLFQCMVAAIRLPVGLVMRAFLFVISANDRSRQDAPWANQNAVVKEVWFRGNHTDVGGGGTAELAQASLGWMCAQAQATSPPLWLSDNPPVDIAKPIDAPLSKKFDLFVSKAPRPILDRDFLHASVHVAAGADTSERFRDRLRFRLRSPFGAPYPPRALELYADHRSSAADNYRLLAGESIEFISS